MRMCRLTLLCNGNLLAKRRDCPDTSRRSIIVLIKNYVSDMPRVQHALSGTGSHAITPVPTAVYSAVFPLRPTIRYLPNGIGIDPAFRQ